MKIFLDDLREFPNDGYQCARDYDDCILLLKLFKEKIDVVNLDYDLGSDKTGLDVLRYMKETGVYPATIIVHSNHETGVKLMEEYISKNFKESVYLHRPV